MTDIHQKIQARFPELPFRTSVTWKNLTSFGIGSSSPLLAEPASLQELQALLQFCLHENIGTFILGRGTNLLGSDSQTNLVVIRLSSNAFSQVGLHGELISSGAWVSLYELVSFAASKGFGGAAGLAGIPGSVGGAVRMNAGAHGASTGDFIETLRGVRTSGELWSAKGSDIHWTYRSNSVPPDVIVTQIDFRFPGADPGTEKARIEEEMELRRITAPKGRNAGCIFKNPGPEGSAGKILDRCGCKNMHRNELFVSDKHANYIINAGNATELDFVSLTKDIRHKVLEETGILLQTEICFVNKHTQHAFNSNPKPIKVLVLKGGCSSEREVSLESGAAVANALRSAGFHVTEFDITKLQVTDEMLQADIVFPVLHGGFGESGEIQKLLEDNKIEFVGSGSRSCSVIMDKVASKKLMHKHNIPTPAYAVLQKSNTKFPEGMKLPVVVKPPAEGSTVGISLVSDMAEWDKAVAHAAKYCQELLVEEYISGTEITVGVVDGRALSPVEIRYPGKMYDYDAKYTHKQGETYYFCPPESLSQEIQINAKAIAEKFSKAVEARDLIRIDMLVQKDGQIFVLEGNSIPGFTASSLLPKAAKAGGISFTELCAKLVNLAAKRKGLI